jgi:hypothetical protein
VNIVLNVLPFPAVDVFDALSDHPVAPVIRVEDTGP